MHWARGMVQQQALPRSPCSPAACSAHPLLATVFDMPHLCNHDCLWSWAVTWIPEMNSLKIIVNNKLLYQHSWGVMNCKKIGGNWPGGRIHLWSALLLKPVSPWLLLSQQEWKWSSIDRILRSWFMGTFKPFIAVTVVNLNSIPLSATLSYSTFEDDREFSARSACDLCGPVPCCKHWPERRLRKSLQSKGAVTNETTIWEVSCQLQWSEGELRFLWTCCSLQKSSFLLYCFKSIDGNLYKKRQVIRKALSLRAGKLCYFF